MGTKNGEGGLELFSEPGRMWLCSFFPRAQYDDYPLKRPALIRDRDTFFSGYLSPKEDETLRAWDRIIHSYQLVLFSVPAS